MKPPPRTACFPGLRVAFIGVCISWMVMFQTKPTKGLRTASPMEKAYWAMVLDPYNQAQKPTKEGATPRPTTPWTTQPVNVSDEVREYWEEYKKEREKARRLKLLMTTTPKPTTTTTRCADQIPNCHEYGNVCTDRGYSKWVAKNCPRFCKRCPEYKKTGKRHKFVTLVPPGTTTKGSKLSTTKSSRRPSGLESDVDDPTDTIIHDPQELQKRHRLKRSSGQLYHTHSSTGGRDVIRLKRRAKSKCRDKSPLCGWYPSEDCEKNPEYMNENCAKTCHTCEENPPCVDKSPLCGWFPSGECEKNPEFMDENCAKTCRVCVDTSSEVNPKANSSKSVTTTAKPKLLTVKLGASSTGTKSPKTGSSRPSGLESDVDDPTDTIIHDPNELRKSHRLKRSSGQLYNVHSPTNRSANNTDPPQKNRKVIHDGKYKVIADDVKKTDGHPFADDKEETSSEPSHNVTKTKLDNQNTFDHDNAVHLRQNKETVDAVFHTEEFPRNSSKGKPRKKRKRSVRRHRRKRYSSRPGEKISIEEFLKLHNIKEGNIPHSAKGITITQVRHGMPNKKISISDFVKEIIKKNGENITTSQETEEDEDGNKVSTIQKVTQTAGKPKRSSHVKKVSKVKTRVSNKNSNPNPLADGTEYTVDETADAVDDSLSYNSGVDNGAYDYDTREVPFDANKPCTNPYKNFEVSNLLETFKNIFQTILLLLQSLPSGRYQSAPRTMKIQEPQSEAVTNIRQVSVEKSNNDQQEGSTKTGTQQHFTEILSLNKSNLAATGGGGAPAPIIPRLEQKTAPVVVVINTNKEDDIGISKRKDVRNFPNLEINHHHGKSGSPLGHPFSDNNHLSDMHKINGIHHHAAGKQHAIDKNIPQSRYETPVGPDHFVPHAEKPVYENFPFMPADNTASDYHYMGGQYHDSMASPSQEIANVGVDGHVQYPQPPPPPILPEHGPPDYQLFPEPRPDELHSHLNDALHTAVEHAVDNNHNQPSTENTSPKERHNQDILRPWALPFTDDRFQGQEQTTLAQVRKQRDILNFAYEEEDKDLNSGYLPWGEWNSCSTTCGLGRKERWRKCIDKLNCYSGSYETKVCLEKKCHGPASKAKRSNPEGI